jgi:hypothetical protein
VNYINSLLLRYTVCNENNCRDKKQDFLITMEGNSMKLLLLESLLDTLSNAKISKRYILLIFFFIALSCQC